VTAASKRWLPPALALAVLGAGCSTTTPAGLRIDLGLNGTTVDTVKISVAASPGGFKPHADSGVQGVTLSNETDASGAPGLTLLFKSPYQFTPTISFRLDTENTSELTMTASALAFNGGALVASATSNAPATLEPGGSATLHLTLAPQMGLITPDTTTTDLVGDTAGVAVLGPQPGGGTGLPRFASLAICDLDGDEVGDFVIGAPNADGPAAFTASGAVYVVFGDPNWTPTSRVTIDLANPGTSPNLVFYGHDPADHLGAAIACVDLDGDGLGDIVVGAPGADAGAGRVYLLHGRRTIHSDTFDLTTVDAQWISSSGTAGLGSGLYVADLDGDGSGDLVAAAAGNAEVHIYSNIMSSPTARNVEVPDHLTVFGVAPTAIGAGDLNGDGKPDLVLGDSEHRPAGAADKTGAVYAFGGVDPTSASPLAVDPTGAAVPPGTPGPTQTILGPPKSQFGAAVLVVDTTGSGADLIVGAPSDASAAGSVFVIEHDIYFFAAASRDASTAPIIKHGPAASGRFGCALAASISGTASNPSADLVVGALGTPRGARMNAGAAYFFKGGMARAFPLVTQLFGAKDNDQLGTVVVGGQINSTLSDKIGDFAALAPNAAGSGANTGAGVVYGMFGSP